MKDFSMFDHALKAARPEQLKDLGQVASVSRRIFEEIQTFRFRAQVPCLEYLNLLIENSLLLRTNRTGRVYVGFEKLSFMEGVLDRYLRIADLSERLYVFGECDWKPPRHPNMRLIPLGHNVSLTRECFLIADSPTFKVMLAAISEEAPDAPNLETRHFSALKSSDPAVVESLSEAAEGLVDESLAA